MKSEDCKDYINKSTQLFPKYSYLPTKVFKECEKKYCIIWLRKYYDLYEEDKFLRKVIFE